MTVPVADRLAIEDFTIAYAAAMDTMHDIDAILALFTPDAVYDLSAIGMANVTGHDGIRSFFEASFAANSAFAHYLSNFAVTAYGGDTASARTYVQGHARGKDGSSICVYGRYYFDLVRTAEGWKANRYSLDILLPLG